MPLFGRRILVKLGPNLARLILATAPIILVTLTNAASSRMSKVGPQLHRFESFGLDLPKLRDELRIPGLAAGIVEDGHLVWQRNYGLADIAGHIPVNRRLSSASLR